jgi:hypothetical protein
VVGLRARMDSEELEICVNLVVLTNRQMRKNVSNIVSCDLLLSLPISLVLHLYIHLFDVDSYQKH